MSFLLVDKIDELSPGEYIRGSRVILPHEYYLTQDESKNVRCFIPSLIGEALGQLAAWNVMHYNAFTKRPVAGIVANAYLYEPVCPGQTLLLESFIERLDDVAVQYHSIAKVNEQIVFQVDGALGPLLPMEEFIDVSTVRQQFDSLLEGTGCAVNRHASGHIATQYLYFDRILHCEPGQKIVAEKSLMNDAPYFPDHFPRKPVLPMTILLEYIRNLVHDFCLQSHIVNYRINAFQRIKMSDFIEPNGIIKAELTLKEQSENQIVLRGRCDVADKRVCVLEIVLRRACTK